MIYVLFDFLFLLEAAYVALDDPYAAPLILYAGRSVQRHSSGTICVYSVKIQSACALRGAN